VGVRGFSEASRRLWAPNRIADGWRFERRACFIRRRPRIRARLRLFSKGWRRDSIHVVTETISMASVPPDPCRCWSRSRRRSKSISLLRNGRVAAGDELAAGTRWRFGGGGGGFLIRLNAQVGSRCGWAGATSKIAAVLKQEPDRITAARAWAAGDDLADALDRTGLIAPGSRASQRLLFETARAARSGGHAQGFEQALPDAQVMDFREGNPALSQGWRTRLRF